MPTGPTSVFIKREIDGFEAEVPLVGPSDNLLSTPRQDRSVLNTIVELALLPVAALMALGSEGAGRWSDLAFVVAALLFGVGGLLVYQAGLSVWVAAGVLAGGALLVALTWVIVGLIREPTHRGEALHIACDLHELTVNDKTWSLAQVSRCFATEARFYVEAGDTLHQWHNPDLALAQGHAIADEVMRFVAHDQAMREGGEVPEALKRVLGRNARPETG